MKRLSVAALALGVLASATASADDPSAGLAVLTGAAVNVAGFIAGGAMLATNHSTALNNAGWFTIQGGFTLAPLAAHAVEGEWGRGALFASLPAACLAGTAAEIGVVPALIDQGTLPEQRLMWALFLVGQFAAVAGVVDAAFAPMRARSFYVAPTVGGGRLGLSIGGTL
jgi:hypothetical protein